MLLLHRTYPAVTRRVLDVEFGPRHAISAILRYGLVMVRCTGVIIYVMMILRHEGHAGQAEITAKRRNSRVVHASPPPSPGALRRCGHCQSDTVSGRQVGHVFDPPASQHHFSEKVCKSRTWHSMNTCVLPGPTAQRGPTAGLPPGRCSFSDRVGLGSVVGQGCGSTARQQAV